MLLRCRLGNKRAHDCNRWVSAASALLLRDLVKRYLVVNMEWALDTIHLKRYGNNGMNSLDGTKLDGLRRRSVDRYASTGKRFCDLELWTNDLRNVESSQPGICVSFGWFKPFSQGRINHCAGCTMGGDPAAIGDPPINCQIFTTLFWRLNVWMFINVTTTTKKVVNFFGEEKCTPEKILGTHMRKGPLPYVGMGPHPPNG